jgi:hypothetical protein
MQKIAIIGPGSIGIAAQMSLLAPQYDIIGFADAPLHVDFAEPGGAVDYGPVAMSHSFDGHYKPTVKEAEWLLSQGQIYEEFKSRSEGWDDLVSKVPPIVRQLNAEVKGAEYHAQRYTRQFTQPHPPTTKARKAARRRAKAGRRATR